MATAARERRLSVLRRPMRPFLALLDALDRRLTPAGRLVLIITSFAAGFGVDTTLSLGYQVFSLGLAALVVSGIAATRMVARVEVHRTAGRFATVGETFTYDLDIRNLRDRTLEGCMLRDELRLDPAMPARTIPRTDGKTRFGWIGRRLAEGRGDRRWRRGGDIRETAVPVLGPHERKRLSLSFVPERRGTVRFEGVSIFRPEPLGIARSAARLPLPARLVVLPRRYPVPPLALPGVRRLQRGGVANAGKVGESEEFLGLRDYRAGDSPKRIHWRSWARVGRPIVRENEDEFFVRHALVLDTFCAPQRIDLLDAAASVAASLAASLETAEALLDLFLVEDRAYHLTAGRGVGEVESILEVVANARPAPIERLPVLAASVRGLVANTSGIVVVLLDWDAQRRALLDEVARSGVACLALLVRAGDDPSPAPADAPAPVRVIRTGHLAADLAAL